MKKYFKPLDFLFYFNCIEISCWIILLFQQDTIFPMWLKTLFLLMTIPKQLIYVKWERIHINFDWILNIIYSKKLQELHMYNIQSFYYNPKHTYLEEYSLCETSLFQSYGIVRVCSKYVNNKIRFCIELKRPGMLIGKGGRNLEEIQKELGLDIYIIESKDIWRNKNIIF